MILGSFLFVVTQNKLKQDRAHESISTNFGTFPFIYLVFT
jgi:hypothetical protein